MRYLAGAAEVRLYQGLDHHAGQPVSPSRQGCSFSSPHLPRYIMPAALPEAPLGLPTRGRSQRHRLPDARPTGTLHMFHMENAKHPQRPAHIWEAAVPSADKRQRFRPPARTPPHSSRRADAYLHSAHWFCIRRLRTRVPVYKSEWVAAVLRVEGVRATGTASQESTQSAIESRAVFGKAWSSTSMEEEELVQVSGRQTHRHTQMF